MYIYSIFFFFLVTKVLRIDFFGYINAANLFLVTDMLYIYFWLCKCYDFFKDVGNLFRFDVVLRFLRVC